MASNDKHELSEKELAQLLITTKERAEDFVDKYIKRYDANREQAIKRLKELDIDLSHLPDK